MIWDADSSSVEDAQRKMISNEKEWEKASLSAVKNASKGYQLIAEHLQKNNAATRQLINENEKLKAKMAEVGKSQESIGSQLKTVYAGVAGILSGQVARAIMHVIDLEDQWNRKLAETGVSVDEVARKFQVQTLMSDKDFSEKFQKEILPLAETFKINPLDVLELGRQAFTSGISQQNLNEVLREIIIGAKATNVGGGQELLEFGKASIGVLKASGKDAGEIKGTDIRGFTQPLSQAFSSKQIEGKDTLSLVAKAGGLIQGFGVDQNELISLFTTLIDRGQLSADEAATKMGGILTKLRTPDEEVAKQLGPELTAALRDKSVLQSLTNLQTGLDQGMKTGRITEADRDQLLKKLFGQENLSAAMILMKNTQFAQGIMGTFGQDTQLREAIKIATSGPAATEQAIAAQEMGVRQEQSPQAVKNEQVIRLAMLELESQGYGGFRRGMAERILRIRASAGSDVLQGLLNESEVKNDWWNSWSAAAPTGAAYRGDFGKRVQERYLRATQAAGVTGPAVAVPVPQLQQREFGSAFAGDPLEKKIKEQEIKIKEKELEVEALKLKAEDPKSRKGKEATPAEKKALGLDVQEQQLDVMKQMLRELQLNKKKEEQRKRNNPNL